MNSSSVLSTRCWRPVRAMWVFAYGSLIWNPLMEFAAQQTATLEGWHRRFFHSHHLGPGQPEQPGRILGLEAGGTTQGIAYQLHEDQALTELRLLWAREMASGVYRPTWGPLVLGTGEVVTAIVFVVNAEQALYEADSTVPTVLRLAANAAGVFGSNADYIRALDDALNERGVADPYISEIARALR